MRVPKILYHGTTRLRWQYIKENGVLRSDLPKADSLQARICWNVGYVYLTSGLTGAILWGLKNSIVDSITRNIPENTNRDPVIIAVKTSNLRDMI